MSLFYCYNDLDYEITKSNNFPDSDAGNDSYNYRFRGICR
jgi:hypothetical protein